MRLRNKPHKCAELTRSASSLLLCSLDRLGFGLNPQGGGNGGWQPPVSSSGLPHHTLLVLSDTGYPPWFPAAVVADEDKQAHGELAHGMQAMGLIGRHQDDGMHAMAQHCIAVKGHWL